MADNSQFDTEIEALQRAYDQLALMDLAGRKRALAYLAARLLEIEAATASESASGDGASERRG